MPRVPLVAERVRWTERKPMLMGSSHLRVYERRATDAAGLRVIVGREPLGPGGAMEWHLSMSAEGRYPTWDELAEARERFLPDPITFGMVLPPRDQYVNLHQTTFHLYELP